MCLETAHDEENRNLLLINDGHIESRKLSS